MSELHKGWTKATLGDVAEIVRGVTYKKEHASQTPRSDLVPLLRATNISQTLSFKGLFYVPSHYVSEVQYLRLGDIVIAASSGSLSVVGKAAILNSEWSGTFGAFCSVARPDSSISAKFIGYHLQTPGYREYVSSRAAGVNINNLKSDDLASFELALAPRNEQDRVVAEIEKQFTRLDAATAALKRVRANLKRYRASVLKAACEGRLVPTEASLAREEGRDYEPADKLLERILRERRTRWEADTLAKMIAAGKRPTDDRWKQKYKEPSAPDTANLPELPEGWCWAAIDQLAADERNSITDGPFGSNLKTSHYTDSGPRVVRLQNVGDGVFREAEAHISEQHFQSLRKHEVHAGDIVIAALGDPAPRACIVPEIGPAIVKADCIRFKPAATLVAEYVSSALNSDGVRKRTSERIHGVGRPRLNLQEIREIVIPLPPVVEQRRLASRIDQIMTTIDRQGLVVDATLRNASAVRRSILADAFRGSLVPQDPTDEPASVLLARIRAERNTATMQKPARRSRKEPAHA